MPHIILSLSRETLEDLYITQRLSLKTIGDKYHCSDYIVRKRILRLGILLRPRKVPQLLRDLTHDILEELYVKQRLPITEIAKRYGCTVYGIYSRARRYGLKRLKTTGDDLTNLQIGDLTVLHAVPPPFDSAYPTQVHWLCQCKCGNKKIFYRHALIQKLPRRSCGCWIKRCGLDSPYSKGWQLSAEGYLTRSSHKRTILQHREIMETLIGRPLLSHETVHHKNGKRDDNRPENLELWVGKHGKGQRLEDLITNAVNLLQQYAPSKLA